MTWPNQSATETPKVFLKKGAVRRVLSHELFLLLVKISWLFILVLFTSFVQWVALGIRTLTYSGLVWNLVLRKQPKVLLKIKVEIHSVLILSYILAGNLDSSKTNKRLSENLIRLALIQVLAQRIRTQVESDFLITSDCLSLIFSLPTPRTSSKNMDSQRIYVF